MKIFFAFLLIIFLAFSGYHLSFRGFRLPLFARKFYLTGTEFLFLGLLLGPGFLNILDPETLMGLEPLAALLLGWIGLLFGCQFEIAKLKRYPMEFFSAAVLESLFTVVLVFCGVYAALPFFAETGEMLRISASVTLAAAAACTAQTGIVLLAPGTVRQNKKTVTLLRYISSIDGLSALLVFIAAFVIQPSFTSGLWSREVGWAALISTAACSGLLILCLLFLSRRRDESDLMLLILGMAVFTSGTALIINYSPLLVNFLIGFCLVNFSRDKERIFNILVSVEKPVYLLLLVFLGAGLHLDSFLIVFLALGYWLFRFIGKLAGGVMVTLLGPRLKEHPGLLGCGLLEQGGLAMAILFDFQQRYSCETVSLLISLAVLGIIYNEFISPHMLKQLLRREK